MNIEVGAIYKQKSSEDSYVKVTKVSFDEKDVLRLVEFTDESGDKRFMGVGLFELEYEFTEEIPKKVRKIKQVFVGDEAQVNYWLKKNSDKEVLDIKFSINNDGELIMIIYNCEFLPI